MDSDFQKRLLATFRVETKEHLNAIAAGLIELEQTTDHAQRQHVLEAVFREAHSLKGAARAVNLTGIESLSHAVEGVFARFRRQESAPSRTMFDVLHQAVDMIDKLLLSDKTGPEAAGGADIRELVRRLEKGEDIPLLPPPEPEQRERPPADTPVPAGTVRIPAGKLDALLHQAEELLTARLAARQRGAELAELGALLGAWEKEWIKVRPVARKLRRARQGTPDQPIPADKAGQLDRLIDFFDASHNAIRTLQSAVQKLDRGAAGDRHSLDVMVTALLDDLKEALMLPCAAMLQVLPKMIRDLARNQGKEAELVVSGETVEIDKRVLEELKDPLIHLLRNCIDHGIERPEERQRRNKPARGRVTVAISIIGSNRIEIRVSDDGGGIDPARLKEAAVRQGIMAEGEAERLGDEELQWLVFRSGLSTASFITDISGRGLGLAIVREKVENLGGAVTVASTPEQGTTFTLLLPLTLSTYRGVLVRSGDQTFIVPAAAVSCVRRVDTAAIRSVGNRETVELDGEAVSFVRLAALLRLPQGRKNRDAAGVAPFFVLGSGPGRIAFGVDDILDEQEVLVKSLGPQLPRVRNVSGATVLGNGKVAVILHHVDLMKSAVKGTALPSATLLPAEAGETAQKSVLIVEDSITSRTLLKNIMETAGYRVVTAVDGMDALTRLRTEQIDLVVSDVDMPRLNGFDLTLKIRASREFADLPVVLVTSLDSREDRERGVEAGANAYIVKSSFDQSNLLEAVRRLI
jgi:two-component system, chemotaxis family, sensor kinase CheA